MSSDGTSRDEHDDEVELGSVTGVFGFRGELRLHLHNPTSDLLSSPREVVLVAPDGRRTTGLLSARPGAGNRIIGRLRGTETEDAATALRGVKIRIRKSSLPRLPGDEFYVWQLEGAAVEIDGQRVGTIVGVQTSGPQDILEVQRADGEMIFVPALREFIVAVDVAQSVVQLVTGALDDELDEDEDDVPADDAPDDPEP